MPRSFRVQKPINVQAGRDEGPNRLRQEAIARRLKNPPKNIKFIGRRGNNKARDVE